MLWTSDLTERISGSSSTLFGGGDNSLHDPNYHTTPLVMVGTCIWLIELRFALVFTAKSAVGSNLNNLSNSFLLLKFLSLSRATSQTLQLEIKLGISGQRGRVFPRTLNFDTGEGTPQQHCAVPPRLCSHHLAWFGGWTTRKVSQGVIYISGFSNQGGVCQTYRGIAHREKANRKERCLL